MQSKLKVHIGNETYIYYFAGYPSWNDIVERAVSHFGVTSSDINSTLNCVAYTGSSGDDIATIPSGTELEEYLATLQGAPASLGISSVIQQTVPSVQEIETFQEPKSHAKPGIYTSWAPRQGLVETLLHKLEHFKLVQVRGTPASGKTTLKKLLQVHLLEQRPDALVYVCSSRPAQAPDLHWTDRFRTRLSRPRGELFPPNKRCYLLFDEAQDSYWDTRLWNEFLKDVQDPSSHIHVIIFCYYGSPSPYPNSLSGVTTLFMQPEARISLQPSVDGDIGLFFTRAEYYQELLPRFPHRIPLDLNADFIDAVHRWTSGHVGFIHDVFFYIKTEVSSHALALYSLQLLNPPMQHEKAKLAEQQLWTLEQFYFGHPSPRAMLKDLSCSPAARGLPHDAEIPKNAAIFRRLLEFGYIDVDKEDDATEEKVSLKKCNTRGWLHTDMFEGKVRYRFPSPIHMACISWSLNPIDVEIPYDTPYDLVIAAIKRLQPLRLLGTAHRAGGRAADKAEVHAQYKGEFYRGLYDLLQGDVRIGPEHAFEVGTLTGRIDFFIPTKEWGVEYTQEGFGLELEGLKSCLTDGATYDAWLASGHMTDYILLDFRATIPTIPHPAAVSPYPLKKIWQSILLLCRALLRSSLFDSRAQAYKRLGEAPLIMPIMDWSRHPAQVIRLQRLRGDIARYSPRGRTIQVLLQKLEDHKLVQVRGTPASGKTILRTLLHAHLLKQHPDALVYSFEGWPAQPPDQDWEHRLRVVLARPHGELFPQDKVCYVLFGEAQDSYWDTYFWNKLLKTAQSQLSRIHVILFCSYGSPSPLPNLHNTSIVIHPSARVSLRPSEDSNIGILLTPLEYQEMIQRFPKKIVLDGEFTDAIYRWSLGHVGVIESLFFYIAAKHEAEMRANKPCTLEQFYFEHPSPLPVLHNLTWTLLGVPSLEDIRGKTSTFRRLLEHGYIDVDKEDDATDEKVSLRECNQCEWLHTDMFEGKVRYQFPSPLHMACISWSLEPVEADIPYDTLHDLAVATIKRLRPSQLVGVRRVGGGGSQEEPAAMGYKAGFYRSLFNLIQGNVRIGLEHASDVGTRAGRIDFFIPTKEWAVECTREGYGLEEQESRFAADSAYDAWLASGHMADHILLDFRTTVPVVPHPGAQLCVNSE
ncbi:hypothetical protein BOTBODRAFT_181262 [Botryobasidium botryosum FD-172 SS1]|uniref:Uncharacterized protein n=1 Tax=Botryobasidium botryosum (strain FD-172 SS1) TaxID=930990 RepID=A0A067M4L8_BOTB1|nr:hypothetical protein BOTBODRAFT_181262 [Botryobasidium botryosum FD-172 SS1]